jgi:hypothetical protein
VAHSYDCLGFWNAKYSYVVFMFKLSYSVLLIAKLGGDGMSAQSKLGCIFVICECVAIIMKIFCLLAVACIM